MNMDAAVDAAVAVDEVSSKETESAALAATALTLAYSSASLIPLSKTLYASAAASTRISRISAAASIYSSRLVHHSYSSSLASAVEEVSSPSFEALTNLKQSEI